MAQPGASPDSPTTEVAPAASPSLPLPPGSSPGASTGSPLGASTVASTVASTGFASGPGGRALAAAASVLLVLLAQWVLGRAVLAFGASLAAVGLYLGTGPLVVALASIVGWTAALILIAYSTHRLAASWLTIAIALLAGSAIAVPRYLASIQPQFAYDFHGVITSTPSNRFPEFSHLRPPREYRMNRFGLRGADFEEHKAPGTLRIALVGDSFVFGMGVDESETIKANLDGLLRARGLGDRVEVLNLGIAGTNLRSHIRMAGIAEGVLGADVVVMGLYVWNDLAVWDGTDERAGVARPGAYSVLSWLVGQNTASVITTMLFVQHGNERRSLAALDALLPSLWALPTRSAGPSPDALPSAVPIVVLAFASEPAVEARFSNRAGVDYLKAPRNESYFIPIDGHPSSEGTRAIAAMLFERLERLPAIRAAMAEGAKR